MMRWTRTLLPINLKISVWKLGKTCCHNKTAKVSAILLSFEIQSNRVFSVLSPREISFQCLFYANWHDFRLFFLIESKIPCLSSRCLLHGLICILYPARCPSALPQRAAGVYVTNWLTAKVEQFILVSERTRVVAFHVSVPIKAKWSYFRRCLAMQMKTKGYITWHTHEFFGVFTFCVQCRSKGRGRGGPCPPSFLPKK